MLVKSFIKNKLFKISVFKYFDRYLCIQTSVAVNNISLFQLFFPYTRSSFCRVLANSLSPEIDHLSRF
jgi:hypothetical protein